jgi:hypothetical protein
MQRSGRTIDGWDDHLDELDEQKELQDVEQHQRQLEIYKRVIAWSLLSVLQSRTP